MIPYPCFEYTGFLLLRRIAHDRSFHYQRIKPLSKRSQHHHHKKPIALPLSASIIFGMSSKRQLRNHKKPSNNHITYDRDRDRDEDDDNVEYDETTTSPSTNSIADNPDAPKKKRPRTLKTKIVAPPNPAHQWKDHEEISSIRSRLLEWYRENYRKLPWRSAPSKTREAGTAAQDSPDPYAVWVSEVMLQQTRVATVIDYFQKWMKEFPTIADLAQADLDRVNEIWAGLGYYRRAKMLHEAAKFIMSEYEGIMPCTYDKLLKIPGIGPYTAGAIASIAFNVVHAAVDGNVIRVISRLRAIPGNPASTTNQKCVNDLTSSLVDIEHPGDFNQSLMELGATICTPKAVRCDECPLRDHCHAAKEAKNLGVSTNDYVLKYPEKVEKAKPREESLLVIIMHTKDYRGNQFLVSQRPKDGLLPGLWEFPALVVPNDSKQSRSLQEEIFQTFASYIESSTLKPQHVGEVVHIFSHIRQTITVKQVFVKKKDQTKEQDDSSPKIKWVDEKGLKVIAMSTQMKKVHSIFSEKLHGSNKASSRMMKEFLQGGKQKKKL